jgi:hypothetical protein
MNMRPDIDINKASEMWNGGFSAGAIAAEFGVTRNAIIGISHRNRDMFPHKPLRGSRYTPAAERVLAPKRELTPEEREQRNLRQAERRRKAAEGRALTDKQRIEASKEEVAEFKAGTSRFLRIHPDDEPRLATGKLLHELEQHECHFPLNHGGPFLFCSEATEAGASYCEHHRERSMPPLERRRLKAAA